MDVWFSFIIQLHRQFFIRRFRQKFINLERSLLNPHFCFMPTTPTLDSCAPKSSTENPSTEKDGATTSTFLAAAATLPFSSRSTTTAARSMTSVITLDGSYGEGGGQILRNGISLATILGVPLQIDRIRARRSHPGLKAQHVASVELPVRLVSNNDSCSSSTSTSTTSGSLLQGNHLRSTTIVFTPSDDDDNPPARERHLTQKIGTAGSICLLLQAALPVALFGKAPVHLTLGGGTNATMAPQYDYWHEVFLPTLQEQFGGGNLSSLLFGITAQVKQRGYFPKGGGQVVVHVKQPLRTNQTLQPIQLIDRGNAVRQLRIRAFCAGRWKEKDAKVMVQAARDFLQQHQPELLTGRPQEGHVETEIVTERNAVGSGMGILIIATTDTGCRLAGSALCHQKQDGAAAGRAAANELVQTWLDGGCVDEWLQDQFILYMALAAGTSRMLTGSLTLHTQTAIWVAEQLTGTRFRVQRLDSGNGNDSNGESKMTSSSSSTDIRRGPAKRPKVNVRKRPPPNADYGTHGRIAGRHLIECSGIGLKGRASLEE